MWTSTRWRQNLMVMLAGSALVVSAVSWSQRHEAVAVPPLPNPQDLSVAFRTVAAEAVLSIVSIETTTKARQVQAQTDQHRIEDSSGCFLKGEKYPPGQDQGKVLQVESFFD